LRSGDEISWYPEREDIEGIVARLERTVEEMRADDAYTATPGRHCDFCPYARECPDRQAVRLKDLVPVENLPF